ncbi:SWIM zinc finger family protein [Paenibacillus caseinilyticus]|uniref:SWIM zinc finger family protein n=1 Tax=Paenibacillus caseinilyticus TaxID=3098138 RepID=UPI0022B8901A|nr:SWIM zinc finger family protein [Paenibacillus caseinilyticus]MCZ8523101.1 hypothetical protein [Paenibacillus caseinilyticus]
MVDAVDEFEPAEVELDLKDLRRSTCECRSDGYCEHMAAVLFEWCEQNEVDPGQLLRPEASTEEGLAGSRLRGNLTSTRPGVTDKASILDSLTTASSLLASTAASAGIPVEGSGPAEWQRYYRSRIHPNRFSSLHAAATLYDKVLEELLPLTKGWAETAAQLYELHVLLFVMKLTEEIQGAQLRLQYDFSYYQRMEVYRDLADRCWKHITDLLKKIRMGEAQENYSLPLLETEEVLHDYTKPASGGVIPWMQIYMALWWGLLWSSQGAAREQGRLRDALEEEDLSAARTEWLLSAQLLFAMRGGSDKEAMRLAERMGHAAPSRVLPYLEAFARMGAWERTAAWLQWLVPWMTRVPGGHLETYFSLWAEAREHLDLEEVWKDGVFALLPRSLDYYAEELMHAGRYREWVDVHLVLGYTPMDFRVSELKPIETENRELLLPWYHHSVELYIAEKNRDAYKRAVRLLKKLQSHYKKLKRTDTWERYLDYLTTRYSRFRALQQEMQKLKKGGDAS